MSKMLYSYARSILSCSKLCWQILKIIRIHSWMLSSSTIRMKRLRDIMSVLAPIEVYKQKWVLSIQKFKI